MSETTKLPDGTDDQGYEAAMKELDVLKEKGVAQTHAVTTPNKRTGPITPVESFKAELAKDYMVQVTNYFKGDKEKAMRFMSAVVYSVRKTPKLMLCERESLLEAFMTCAEYQLYPSQASGEAYVIPYADKAQFQLGYQGIITLLYRAGVQAIRSQIVYEKDAFNYQEGLETLLEHKPFMNGDRGKPIAVYAIAVVNGISIFKVMTESDVMKFKQFSKSKDTKFTPWNPENDPGLAMWAKTCIKQLAKTLPKNDELVEAFEKDNQDSIIADRHGTLDAGGPAVGRAFHQPEE